MHKIILPALTLASTLHFWLLLQTVQIKIKLKKMCSMITDVHCYTFLRCTLSATDCARVEILTKRSGSLHVCAVRVNSLQINPSFLQP